MVVAQVSASTIHKDVLIIGAGPHGLAVASRLLREQATGFRCDTLTDTQHLVLGSAVGERPSKALRVRVLDERGKWMATWKDNFAAMRIPYLRSRVTAHPDPRDVSALLDYAMTESRCEELQEHGRDKVPGGGSGRRGRRRRQHIHKENIANAHTFARPASSLFTDFCDHLATSLGDAIGDIIEGQALDIQANDDGSYMVKCSTCEICTHAVVLACGGVGSPRIPQWAVSSDSLNPPPAIGLPPVTSLPRVVHTRDLCREGPQALATLGSDGSVIVVGAGMSGCWLALAVARSGRPVTLVSRSGLRVQQYDTGDEWWGRAGNRKLCEFFACEVDERAAMVHAARGNGHGTMTPELWTSVRRAVKSGALKLVEKDEVSSLKEGGVLLRSGRSLAADAIVLATGMETNCMACDFFKNVASLLGGVKAHHGMPEVDDDLRLDPDHQIFVAGALAALSVGPHAHNLEGARSCSRVIADALVHEREDLLPSVVVEPRLMDNSFRALLDEAANSEDSDSENDLE